MPTSPPILVWSPAGGVSTGPISNPPVYSQNGITQLVEGQAYIDVVFGSIQTDDEWVLGTCEVENTTDFEPLNIWPGIITDRTTAGFRLQLNGMPDSENYYLHWAVSGVNILPTPATSYYLTGPATGAIGISSVFTVRLPPSTTVSGTVTITPNDGGAGGSFDVGSVTLSTSNASATFAYTPVSIGAKTISTTNSSSILSDPAGVVLTVTPPVATTYTLSGPSSGAFGVASTNFTVALPGGATVTGTVTITPSSGGGGGTFTPTTVGLTTGAPSATFTYTPASSGAKTISTTNNGGLTDPGSLTYTVAAFDPTSIAGCKLWLKADSLALSDGTAVATWTDSSGSGNNFTQANGAKQPIFKTAIVNGNPVVRFDGVDDYLGATASIIPTTITNYTVLAVAYPSASAVGAIFASGVVASSSSVLLAHDTTQWFLQHNNPGFVYALDAGVGVGTWRVVSCDWNGTNIHLWRNGTLKDTSGATTMASVGTNNSVGLDTPDGSTFPWTGDIAEILVYNSSLSPTDRTNAENYLKAKYGL